MDIKIYPINTGSIRLDKGIYVTSRAADYGQEVDVPTNAFLIIAGQEKTLVDTGMSETSEADWHHPGSYQPEGFRIDQQLSKLGVEPEEINRVIFTHLHWDHCANMKLFKNAEFWVHRKELEFALDPHILYYRSYNSEKLGAEPAFKGVEFKTVEGEYQLNDVISLVPTPGHCPGHQAVTVSTGKGTFVIAGDAVFCDENLKPDEHRNLPFTPMGRFVNVFDLYESMTKIIDKADVVLTSHGRGGYKQEFYSGND